MKLSSLHWPVALAFLPTITACSQSAPKVEALYQANCASCHGAAFEGGQGGSLIDNVSKHGGSDEEVARSIAKGYPTMGMTGWENVLKPDQIRALVILLREKQQAELSKKNAPPRPLPDQPIQTKYLSYRLQVVTRGLQSPWGLAFLPDGSMLVTEKAGPLRIISADGTLQPKPVRGTPQVMNHGQGGMMSVGVHPEYAKNGWIYLGFADGWKDEKGDTKTITAVVRGRIKDGAWVDQEWIYRADKKFYSGAGVHFGTRFVFDQGYVYFVVGERGGGMEAQDLTRPNGKIFRLFDDGRTPPDNPFVSQPGAEPGIWSYGHRNPQGLTKDPRDGAIYETEHGPRGGDEFNLIQKGRNYGWPVITYGMGYDGRPITSITAREGMEQPISHWTPSIAACGLAIYTGDKFPQWKYDFFAGSLRAQELHRLRVTHGKLTEEEIVLKGVGRIREVQSGPDGAIYLVFNGPDLIARLVPAP